MLPPIRHPTHVDVPPRELDMKIDEKNKSDHYKYISPPHLFRVSPLYYYHRRSRRHVRHDAYMVKMGVCINKINIHTTKT